VQEPPPQIDSALVVAYANVEDIAFRRSGRLYVDGEVLEKVPRLAICVSLGEDLGPLLFHCDEQWNCLGTSGGDSIDDVKTLAEQNYPGVAARWKDSGYSREDAVAHYDSQSEGLRCSFCGRRPYEMDRGMIEGREATICFDCVERLHADVRGQ
jgi:hypothetical protein